MAQFVYFSSLREPHEEPERGIPSLKVVEKGSDLISIVLMAESSRGAPHFS